MERWLTPGPRRFSEQVVDSLRDGLSVVVARPEGVAEGLLRELEMKIVSSGPRIAAVLDADELAGDPYAFLDDRLALGAPHAPRRSVKDLCARMPGGAIVIVTSVDSRTWPAWKRLLCEFEHSARAYSEFERPLLLVEASGVGMPELTIEAVGIRLHAWRDVIGELDMQLYVASRLPSQRDIASRVLRRQIARLAAWDFDLADQLLNEPGEAILSPVTMLTRLLAEGRVRLPAAPGWETGGSDSCSGVEIVHAVLQAHSGDKNADLTMRLWAAQAAEVLPAVEIARRFLVQRMSLRLGSSVTFEGRRITDLHDLEIGQLSHLAYLEGLPESITEDLSIWKGTRNRLAHLGLLDAVALREVSGRFRALQQPTR